MVNVIGLGYIGLPTALMLAAHGVEVVGTDYNPDLIATLNSGKTTFEERDLDELFDEAIKAGIAFTVEYQTCDTYIVSVPTPYDERTKKIDPAYVLSAVSSIVCVCPKGALVIIESTISPKTIDRFVRPLLDAHGMVVGEDINLAHAPERIIPGDMVNELVYNNRTVGVDDPLVGEQVRSLYASFCRGDIEITDIRTAEMTKVVENTFRDVNIAFANELTRICHADNMNVHEIIRIANRHPRVNILSPGPGVGGHCISVDPWFLVGDYPDLTNLIRQARGVNDSMPEYVLERAMEIMRDQSMSDMSKVGIYGLTYKENVDDTRESPTLQMLENIKRHLAIGLCRVYDPWVKNDLVPNQVHSMEDFLEGLEMVIVMVGHDQIKENIHLLANVIILDTRDVCGVGENVCKL